MDYIERVHTILEGIILTDEENKKTRHEKVTEDMLLSATYTTMLQLTCRCFHDGHP